MAGQFAASAIPDESKQRCSPTAAPPARQPIPAGAVRPGGHGRPGAVGRAVRRHPEPRRGEVALLAGVASSASKADFDGVPVRRGTGSLGETAGAFADRPGGFRCGRRLSASPRGGETGPSPPRGAPGGRAPVGFARPFASGPSVRGGGGPANARERGRVAAGGFADRPGGFRGRRRRGPRSFAPPGPGTAGACRSPSRGSGARKGSTDRLPAGPSVGRGGARAGRSGDPRAHGREAPGFRGRVPRRAPRGGREERRRRETPERRLPPWPRSRSPAVSRRGSGNPTPPTKKPPSGCRDWGWVGLGCDSPRTSRTPGERR